jgi:hypothetical protein
MSKKTLLILSVFSALFPVLFSTEAKAQSVYSLNFRDRFIIQSVRLIHSAEATYQATIGAGTYGSLAQLREAGYIDAALATGQKYGYTFTLTVTHPTATTGAKLKLNATPQNYPRSGRRSFYIDEFGEIRGADRNGLPADAMAPIIDDCSLYGDVAGNERCTISAMRVLYSAEMTYSATIPSSFGLLTDLFLAGLIGRTLASGEMYGYYFMITVTDPPNSSFKIIAVPQNYGLTGQRSFYMSTEGVLRGADKQGQHADENDPPIDN